MDRRILTGQQVLRPADDICFACHAACGGVMVWTGPSWGFQCRACADRTLGRDRQEQAPPRPSEKE